MVPLAAAAGAEPVSSEGRGIARRDCVLDFLLGALAAGLLLATGSAVASLTGLH